MEFISTILVIIIAIFGFVSLFKDGAKGGAAAIILDVILVFAIALFG